MTGYLHPMEDEIRLDLGRVGDKDSVNVQAVNGEINDVFGGVTPRATAFAAKRYLSRRQRQL